MNLFVFNDPHGYNLNLVIEHCGKAGQIGNNFFINLTKKTIYKNNKTEYLDQDLNSFKKKIRSLPAITSVVFCPLDHITGYFLNELKLSQPGVKVKWIFWGYEYYHQPGLYEEMLTGFSSQFYKRKKRLKKITSWIKSHLKKLLFIPVYNKKLLEESYQHVDEFYSFLPQDYKNIFNHNRKTQSQYFPISFLSIEQITKNINKETRTNEIMIGHAGRLTANHVEIFEKLASLSVSNKLFIPFQYGDHEYKTEIKKMATGYFGERAEFLEVRLDMQSYFQRLSTIDYAIFNFVMSEGLGNIVFLIWNGAKVFLKEESSAYQQFKFWGSTIFSVENDLNLENLQKPLDGRAADQNKQILANILSENNVKEYWKRLFQ